MSEELKNRLDTFIKNLTMKMGDRKEDIPEIQREYDDLMEFYSKVTVLSNEEFISLDKAITKYDSIIKELKEEISIYKSQKEIDNDKINSMLKEIANCNEIKNKYEKLSEEYKSLKQKYSCCYNDSVDVQMKIKTDEKIINDLQNEISNLKKENFEKFERIIFLEKNYKLNEIKLNQEMDKVSKYSIENNDLSKENIELRNNMLDMKKEYQSKLLVLERQVKHLSEANANFLKENKEVRTKLEDFQMYTNMAKVYTKKLNKEDFSILETMSKRAEVAELEVQKLKAYIKELKSMNEKLKHKIKPLEDYALLQIKHDHEINTGNSITFDLNSLDFTEDEKKEIMLLKKQPNELMQTLFKLKAENLELHNQLKDITIECNQQLREAKLKK